MEKVSSKPAVQSSPLVRLLKTKFLNILVIVVLIVCLILFMRDGEADDKIKVVETGRSGSQAEVADSTEAEQITEGKCMIFAAVLLHHFNKLSGVFCKIVLHEIIIPAWMFMLLLHIAIQLLIPTYQRSPVSKGSKICSTSILISNSFRDDRHIRFSTHSRMPPKFGKLKKIFIGTVSRVSTTQSVQNLLENALSLTIFEAIDIF